MRGRTVWGALALAVATMVAAGDDWPQWRGPERTGISKEKGLLQSWPEGGPKKLWAIQTPGGGYAACSVVGQTIYLTGTEQKKGVLYALDLKGKIRWRQVYGAEWTENNPMARTTPTIDEGCAYVYSGQGSAASFDAATGEPKWIVDTFGVFKGRNIEWGIAESPLIVGNLYICHPGGPDAAVVALDKKTGKTAWTTKGLSDRSAYCSPLLVEFGGTRQIVTQTENHVVGIRADDGTVLWKVPQRNRYAVHPNTPLFFDGMIFVSCGYGYGSQLLKLSDDGKTASQVWTEKKMDNHHEGVIYVDGRIHGCGSRNPLLCLSPRNGEVLYKVPEVRKAGIVYADGRLYCYDENGGKVSLVDLQPTGAKLCGQVAVTEGSGPHWAHPIVANGVLYIRHGEALLAYDVKAN